MLRLFRYLRGYIIIVFSGENAEKILNICANNGLNIWGMICKKGCITAKMDIGSFKELRTLRRGTKTKIKIIKKCGLPFFTEKYKHRIGFVTGALLFLAVLQLLSNYIWSIEVNGNKRITEKEIISMCGEMGIKTGIKSKK